MRSCSPFQIGREAAPMNFQIGEGVEGPEVSELAVAVVKVVWKRIDKGREGPNGIDRISRAQFRAKSGQIEPLMGSPMRSCLPIVETGVVEVEPVDVEIGPWPMNGDIVRHADDLPGWTTKRRGRPEAASHPVAEAAGDVPIV